MELPSYFIVGSRPVKFVDDGGGMTILAYDWKTGEFQAAIGSGYLEKVLFGKGDIEELSEKEFEEYVEKLRKKR